MRLTPTIAVSITAMARQYTFVIRRSATRISIAPSVRYTIADSIAWPLGKLVDQTSRSAGTTVGRGRLKACFIALSTSSPLKQVSATATAVRLRPCSSRKPTTLKTTSPRTAGLPSAVRSTSDEASQSGPIGRPGSSGLAGPPRIVGAAEPAENLRVERKRVAFRHLPGEHEEQQQQRARADADREPRDLA